MRKLGIALAFLMIAALLITSISCNSEPTIPTPTVIPTPTPTAKPTLWSADGYLVDFTSLCDIYNRQSEFLFPHGVTFTGGYQSQMTGCLSLDENGMLQQALAVVVKVYNTANVSRSLTVPLLSEVVVHTKTDSKAARAFFVPWGEAGGTLGWATDMKGRLAVEVDPNGTIEMLYLVPKFSDEVTIEIVDVGLFKVQYYQP